MALKDYHCWLVQETTVLGDFKHNLNRAKAWIRHATAQGHVDLVVFPECFLTGYP